MTTAATISEADILEHLVSAEDGGMDPDAARAILEIRFDKSATQQIRRLLRKNNQGTISAEERIALGKFLRVGQLINLLHAKARLSLKDADEGG